MKNSKLIYTTDAETVLGEKTNDQAEVLLSNMKIRLHLDRQKGNRIVTLIRGLEHRKDTIINLTKELKKKCGSGGSYKETVIIIQGNKRETIQKLLSEKGYNVKFSGG